MKMQYPAHRRRILSALLALVLVCATVLSLTACSAPSKSQPDKYFRYVEEQSITNGVDTLMTYYSDLLDNASQKSGAGSATLQLTVGDQLLNLFTENVGLDLSFLNDLRFSLDTTLTEQAMQAAVTIAAAKQAIGTVDVIADTESGSLFISIPEFFAQTLSLPLEELGLDFSDMNAETLPTEALEKLPSEKELERLIDKYVGIVLDNLGEAETKDDTLTAGGVSEACTSVTTTLTGETLADICIAVIPEAAKDKTLQSLLEAIDEVAQTLGEDAGLAAAYLEFQQEADTLVEEIREDAAEYVGEIFLNWTDYINKNNEIIGRTLDFAGAEAQLTYSTAHDGDDFGFALSMTEYGNPVLDISGTGTDKKDVIGGTFYAAAGGETVLIVTLEDFDTKKFADGVIDGRIALSLPNTDWLDLDELDDTVAAMFDASTAFCFDIYMDDKTVELDASVETRGAELLGITVTTKEEKASKIKIPTKDITENADEWLAAFDSDKLFTAMTEAGIPAEIVSILTLLTTMS